MEVPVILVPGVIECHSRRERRVWRKRLKTGRKKSVAVSIVGRVAMFGKGVVMLLHDDNSISALDQNPAANLMSI